MNTLVYIGAGNDCIPLLMLDSIQEFIYIDSQPQSEFGTLEFESGELRRDRFLPRLDALLRQIEFVKVKEAGNYLEYKNKKGQVLKYYINTPFPEMLTGEIKDAMATAENLMIAGFDPNTIVLELMPRLRNIYCHDSTVYVSDEYDSEYEKEVSVFYHLKENKGPYKYYIIKQRTYFEYWEDANITLEAKAVHAVERCDGLDNFYLLKPQLI
jgi:hypothetical protein